jgi:hypothetical protein
MMGRGDWWAIQATGRPTFYLDADVQGFTTPAGAVRVAMHVLFGDDWDETSAAPLPYISAEHLGQES